MSFSLKPFDRFVLRTPSMPTSELLKILSSDLTDEELFNKLLHDYEEYNFLAGVFVAAPQFYRTMMEAVSAGKPLDKSHLQTLFKYFIRACSRATPFGLFAGPGLGQLGSIDKAVRNQGYEVKVLLDSRLHVTINEHILTYSYLRKNIRFYTNSTIHEVGEKHVFVEYKLQSNDLSYQLSSIDKSYYVDWVVTKAKAGIAFEELAKFLKDDDFSDREIEEFWFELIDSKIILSEFFFSAYHVDSQNDSIQALCKSIVESNSIKSPDDEEALRFLTFVTELLIETTSLSAKRFDIRRLIDLYDRLRNKFTDFGIQYDEKRLFQFDTLHHFSELTLSELTIGKIEEAVRVLSHLTVKRSNSDMLKFISEFEHRYEAQDVPLLTALSSDYGIGYPVRNQHTPEKTSADVSLSSAEIFLHNKLLNSLLEGSGVIELSDEDFKDWDTDARHLPPTFSCLAQIHTRNKEQIISIREVGGGSAANVIARFGSLSPGALDYVNEIARYEQEVSDGICAEVVHLLGISEKLTT